MLGRVSSLDWLISIGLLPLSFALTAPVAAADRARARPWSAPASPGRVVTLAALFLPGMRDVEREQDVPPAHPQAEVPVDVVIVATVLHQAPSAAPPVAAARRIYP